MGSFLSRALLMVLGYAYPAYECFKAVENKEKNKPEIEQLQFWCHYWILAAIFTTGERLGDAFFSWLPMYTEAKLAFLIYLWHPKTKGTAFVYNVLLRPFVANYETEIDRNLLKLEIKAREIGLLFWEEAAFYGQTRFFQILQYLSSHLANSQPKSDQQQVGKEAAAGHLVASPLSSPNTNNKKLISGESATVEAAVSSSSSNENGNLNSSKQEALQVQGKWRLFWNAANREKTRKQMGR